MLVFKVCLISFIVCFNILLGYEYEQQNVKQRLHGRLRQDLARRARSQIPKSKRLPNIPKLRKH